MDCWKSLLKTRKIMEVGVTHTYTHTHTCVHTLHRAQQNSTSVLKESFFTSVLSLCFVCSSEVNQSYVHSVWFSLEDGSPR